MALLSFCAIGPSTLVLAQVNFTEPKSERPSRIVDKMPDISGKWMSDSPLDRFVRDDSDQPVNSIRIERGENGSFMARYLGEKATSFNLYWNEEDRQFDGSQQLEVGTATFVVKPTGDAGVLTCEIDADFRLNSDGSHHKDTWRRMRSESRSPKFLESADIILTETKEGLVAYNKLNGSWSRIDVPPSTDGKTALEHSTVSTGFVSATINGELLGYCNRVSRWARLKIPTGHLGTVKVNHTQSAVTATVGDKLYILSAATGEWETPDDSKSSNDGTAVKKPIDTPGTAGRRATDARESPALADSEEEAWRAAKRYLQVRKSKTPTDPSVVQARTLLERLLEKELDLKLKDEQQRIADLKERIRHLEEQVEKRTANRAAVIKRHAEELVAAVEKSATEIEQIDNKVGRMEQTSQQPVLLYAESADLPPEIQKETEKLIVPYMEHLKKLGFSLQHGQVTLRLQPGMGNAHYYPNNKSIVMDPKVVRDESVMRREYNHHALFTALDEDSKEVYEKCSGIESALADYLGCSSCGEPEVGAIFARELGYGQILRTMTNQKRLSDVSDASGRHAIGEPVSGALWDMREEMGDEIDQLLHKAWIGMAKVDASEGQITRFARSLLKVAQKDSPQHFDTIRECLARRGLTLP